MTHQKRISAPESWPLDRKNTVYTVGAQAGPHDGEAVPLLVFVRDVLGYVDSAKELRYAIENGGVEVNGDPVDPQTPVGTFDIVGFPGRDEFFRVFPGEGGRLALVPVEEDAAGDKLARVEDKTPLEGGRVQLNLHNGANVEVEDVDDYSTKDSVVVDLDSGDIVTSFEFTKGCAVTAVDGKHSGEVGELVDRTVHEGSGDNTVEVETEDGGSFETVEEYVFVIGDDVDSLEEQEAEV